MHKYVICERPMVKRKFAQIFIYTGNWEITQGPNEKSFESQTRLDILSPNILHDFTDFKIQ